MPIEVYQKRINRKFPDESQSVKRRRMCRLRSRTTKEIDAIDELDRHLLLVLYCNYSAAVVLSRPLDAKGRRPSGINQPMSGHVAS